MTMTFAPQNHQHPRPARSARPVSHRSAAPHTTTVSSPISISLLGAVALALAIIVALVGFGGGAAATSPAEAVSPNSEFTDSIEVYIVQPGDTLWAIATEIAQPGEDVRPIVDALKERAGGSSLEVGQRIVIDHQAIRGF